MHVKEDFKEFTRGEYEEYNDYCAFKFLSFHVLNITWRFPWKDTGYNLKILFLLPKCTMTF